MGHKRLLSPVQFAPWDSKPPPRWEQPELLVEGVRGTVYHLLGQTHYCSLLAVEEALIDGPTDGFRGHFNQSSHPSFSLYR